MKPVFIHISKNAGTSIIASAANHITVAGHQSAARWVASHGRASPIFAVIRNPYDRVYSEYHYRRRRYEAGEKDPHLVIMDYPFDDWVVATFRDGLFRTRSFFNQTGIRYRPKNMVDDMLIWFISQCRWLCDDTGQNLTDELLRFENLTSDWSQFSKKHGFDCALQHHNVSTTRPDSRPNYSPRARDLIFEYYRNDFDAFDYPY